MKPGIQHDILNLMEAKSKLYNHKYCLLVLDEMQILPGIQYDPTLKSFVGCISKEFCSDKDSAHEATHALVYMVKGLAEKWKQSVGKLKLGILHLIKHVLVVLPTEQFFMAYFDMLPRVHI